MADLIGDDTPGFFFAHAENLAAPSRRLFDRVLSGCVFDKLLRQLRKQDRECGGFHHPTSGMALAYLGLLRDPNTREDLLRLTGFSPEYFRCDEDIARGIAVGLMIHNMTKMFEAEFNKRFDQFCHERSKAQKLHELGEGFQEDARRHVWKALAHLEAARSVGVRVIMCYAGWSLELDFSLRAPRLVAELVTHTLGLRPKMKERQARYLCGWEQRRAKQTA
jgi:hypothetical protein